MSISAVWANPASEPWFALSARMRAYVQEAAGRTDLITVVSPKNTDPTAAPACFIPSRGEVHFAAHRIFIADATDPDTIDPQNPADRARHPHLLGLACHEAAHAAHTVLTFPAGANPAAVTWATVLEEPRIEAALVRRAPKYREWLRASTLHFHTTGGVYTLDERGGEAQAVHTAILTIGRQIGGILTAAEVRAVRTEIAKVVGDVTMERLDEIITAALDVADGDTAALVVLGQQIVDLLPETDQQDDSPDADADADAGSGSGDNTGGEGSGGDQSGGEGSGGDRSGTDSGCTQAVQLPCGSWTDGDVPDGEDPYRRPDGATGDDDGEIDSALTSAVKTMANEVEQKTKALIAASGGTVPARNKAREQNMLDAAASAQAWGSVQGYGRDRAPIAVTYSRPTPADQDAARRLTARIRRAEYRGSERSRVKQPAPPGRMRTSALMQRHAQNALGLRPTAEPWTRIQRREIPQPKLVVGLSSDVSDSMTAYQQGVGRIAYALGQAISHLGGTLASVAWNSDVAVVAHPGEQVNQVRTAECAGGSLGCALSLRALDGALSLATNTVPVRIVVVVTDGQIPHTAANEQIDRLSRAGVHILWVTPYADAQVTDSVTPLILAPPAPGEAGGEFGDRIGTAIAALLAAA